MTFEAAPGTPGPFEVRHEPSPAIPSLQGKLSRGTSQHQGVDAPWSSEEVPRRRYDCANYEVCLSLAASLNWESFTCRGCSGQTNENLVWRARISARKDSVAAKLLRAEPLTPISSGRTTNAGASTPGATQL